MNRLPLILAVLLVSATVGRAQPIADPRVADLAQTGKVRVGLFPPQYTKDPTTGALKLVWAEIARAFAARVGVQLVLVERPTPPEAIACLKTQACDLLFLPFDDRAASVGDFSNPIFQFDYTLLVPAGSPVRSVADADRPGVRIAAVRNHASTVTLSGLLKQAELVYAETPEPTFDLLRAGTTHLMASTRNALLQFSDQLPGSRVLEDRYGANINRMVVPKGKAGWLAYVTEFVEEAKASGLVQKAIDRAGPRGVTVATPGDSK
ncbi:MAG: polar amino acid transport system substrate-binding protein [Alphaproteobacteria bacterium]|jgi:polar amino acid transport system substrate-binding protein|nr:polar amino acid transport system substrate-binding protein [Alphaproteobacteria bacterium]